MEFLVSFSTFCIVWIKLFFFGLGKSIQIYNFFKQQNYMIDWQYAVNYLADTAPKHKKFPYMYIYTCFGWA